MDSIKVSIIVPVYNVEKYLSRCLDSLVNQTLKDIEIVVINDGSQDKSQTIIDEYSEKNPTKIVPYIKPNGGVSDARNYGLQKVHGKFIGFVDGDDYIDTSMYEKLYVQATKEDADIAVCEYYTVDADTDALTLFKEGIPSLFGTNIYEEPKLLYRNGSYLANKIFRTELFRSNALRFPVGRIFEDVAMIYRLLLNANKIVKVNEPLYYYLRRTEGSITLSSFARHIEILDALTIVNEYYKQNKAFEIFRRELEFINIKHIFFRFRDFTQYKNRKLQSSLLKSGYRHLYQYFPKWKSNTLTSEILWPKKLNPFIESKFLWRLVILTPKPIIRFFLRHLLK